MNEFFFLFLRYENYIVVLIATKIISGPEFSEISIVFAVAFIIKTCQSMNVINIFHLDIIIAIDINHDISIYLYQ